MIEYLEAARAIFDTIKAAIEMGKLVKIVNEDIKKKLQDPKVLTELTKLNPTIVIINGDGNNVYVGALNKMPADTRKEIFSRFSADGAQNGQEVNFVEREFNPRLQEYRNAKLQDEKLDKILQHLNLDYKNILFLSIYVKQQYDKGNPEEANRVKSDIGYQYGKDGRKLCNLYLTQYIESMIDYLMALHENNIDKLKEEVNKTILDLLKKPIFYVHQGSDMQEIEGLIIYSMHRREPYIAIHSAGLNIPIAKKIGENIYEKVLEYKYDWSTQDAKTTTKCPIYNIIITVKSED